MQRLYERARGFVYRDARPLELALWQLYFEGGSRKAVTDILAAYQNPDGGFGHGLESDMLNPGSSPLQTSTAVGILRDIGLFDPKHSIVQGVIRYLESGAHFDGHCWANTVPESNDYPHAPWWTYSERQEPRNTRNYNPSALLIGYLLRASAPEGSARALGKRLALEAHDYFMNIEQETEMHLLPCYLAMCADVESAEPVLFDCGAMRAKLRKGVKACVLRDADRWEGSYCALPSHFLSGRDDPLYGLFPELAERECDFIARTQLEDGSWPVTWRWEAYPEAFAISAKRWQGVIALNNLRYLQGMERL